MAVLFFKILFSIILCLTVFGILWVSDIKPERDARKWGRRRRW